MSINMLNRRLVSPRNLIARQAEYCCDFIPFARARRPAAEHNGQDALLLQARLFGELAVIQLMLSAQFIDAFGCVHNQGLLPNWGPWPYTWAIGFLWPQAIWSRV